MSDQPGYRRIATEEAFAPPEILDRYRALLDAQPAADPGFTSLWGFYLGTSRRATQLVARLTDLGARRLRDMDLSVLGPDRVLYAMDYPYQYVPEEVKVIDALPIGDLDKRKLFQLDAERVFAL
jgi:hypothetical protein